VVESVLRRSEEGVTVEVTVVLWGGEGEGGRDKENGAVCDPAPPAGWVEEGTATVTVAAVGGEYVLLSSEGVGVKVCMKGVEVGVPPLGLTEKDMEGTSRDGSELRVGLGEGVSVGFFGVGVGREEVVRKNTVIDGEVLAERDPSSPPATPGGVPEAVREPLPHWDVGEAKSTVGVPPPP